MDQLSFARTEPETRRQPGLRDRARWAPWLLEPQPWIDFVIDGDLLSDALEESAPGVLDGLGSVVDEAWPEDAARALRVLDGTAERAEDWETLEPGRAPLYSCRECDDIYCGVVSALVSRAPDEQGRWLVTWSAFRYDDGRARRPDSPDLSAVPDVVFDGAAYHARVSALAAMLESRAVTEDIAKVEWRTSQADRSPLSRWRSRLTKG